MSEDRYAELFSVEAREHLDAASRHLVELEEDPDDAEAMGALFRAVHTIKGNAGAMGYGEIADLAHRIENVLDGLRRSGEPLTADVVDVLLAGVDTLEEAVLHATGEREGEPDTGGYVTRLAGLEPGTEEGGTETGGPGDRGDLDPPGPGRWVRVRLDPESPLRGARGFLAVRAAEEVAPVAACHPPVSSFEDEGFAGEFLLRFEEEPEDGEVREALEGVGDVVEVSFLEVEGEGDGAAPGPGGNAGGRRSPRIRHIRVQLEQLDALQNRIGELAIVKGRLQRMAAEEGGRELREVSTRASRLVGELQDEIMAARMVPVWQVFDRFPRLVRDVSRQLGKEVDFEVTGEEIELDRSLLDEVADPLVHLLRNAVDHGIEDPEEREAAGKPREGKIRLSADRERSSVLIRVEDDGRGIDRSAVLKRAVDEGLVDQARAESLPDEDLFRFITRTGFSTRREVSDVSGRGVGLDVVASRVRAMGGQVELESTPGEGTAVTIRLPFTLAIAPALLLRVGGEQYALPLTLVGEVVEARPEEIRADEGRPTLEHRGEVVPLVSLRRALDVPPYPESEWIAVVMVEIGERLVGLVADELVDQQEVVVKSFQPTVETLPYFSGVTVLSDGRPALILEPSTVAVEELPREAIHG